ncbi:MAG: alkaline phosphatase family protein [Acidobacteriaceae bacterium]
MTILNRFVSFACALGLVLALPLAAHAAPNDGSAATHGPIVVVITLDGFPARALNDPRLPMSTLRMLEANGAHADAMQPINPTVTWPNHTALITGVNASVSHVMVPTLASTDQAPDLYMFAKSGYAFAGGTKGPIMQDLTQPRGAHGYANDEDEMQALFIASGAHIRPGVDLGSITNLRVAPTIAKVLGVSLPAAKQKPLTEVLQ